MSRWHKDIDKITQSFSESFGALPQEALNWQPAPGRWSIAQNIDHLIRINESYFPAIKQIRQGSYRLPWTARFGFISSFFGKMLLKAVQPGGGSKVKTFGIWEPSPGKLPANILSRFEKHQQALKQQIEESTELLEAKALISSPANRLLVYRLETAFDILVSHEKRHFLQAKQVLSELKQQDPAAVQAKR